METEKAERLGVGTHGKDCYSRRATAIATEHGSMAAHWCWKVEAMRLLVTSDIPRTVKPTGNGGAWLWLNRTPHVVVSAPEPVGDTPWVWGFEIGPYVAGVYVAGGGGGGGGPPPGGRGGSRHSGCDGGSGRFDWPYMIAHGSEIKGK